MILHATPALDDAVRAHKRYFGDGHYDRVVDQLLEEMAELSVELLKRRRNDVRSTRPDNTRAEIFDVLLCLEFLSRIENIYPSEVDETVTSLAAGLALACNMAADVREGKRPAALPARDFRGPLNLDRKKH